MDDLKELAKTSAKEPVRLRGFYRVQIEEDGQIVGNSGWQENVITNLGKRNLALLLGGVSGSSQASHVALGSGGLPATDATTLAGEVVVRAAVTAASNGSTAINFTATFASAVSFVTNTQNISNIGLFATSSGGTLLSGNTFASSSCATNQAVNATYTWTFS